MGLQVRVELTPRNDFWRNAFFVEWYHQFSDRELITESAGLLLVQSEWMADLERVAEQCFSKVLVAPDDPSRRRMLRCFLPSVRQ
ncbi:MAG: hypothetical protein EBU88_17995 [Acidobacteria bacterium]|nr:hypothetical protein [Acidobacteriota bacterium]